MNQIEEEIQHDLFKDKIKKIYSKFRLYIFFILLILILGPVFFQINNLYLEKKNQKFIELYSKSILLINNDKESEGLEILNQLKVKGNLFTKVLSVNRLIDYYLNKNDIKNALEEINYAHTFLNNNKDLLSEILAIKKSLLTFDNISEKDILDLLRPNESNKIFKSSSNKILYDFYIMKNQHDKAKQFLKS